jgi:hypothetical protein
MHPVGCACARLGIKPKAASGGDQNAEKLRAGDQRLPIVDVEV